MNHDPPVHANRLSSQTTPQARAFISDIGGHDASKFVLVYVYFSLMTTAWTLVYFCGARFKESRG
jgi:hypothetical protein